MVHIFRKFRQKKQRASWTIQPKQAALAGWLAGSAGTMLLLPKFPENVYHRKTTENQLKMPNTLSKLSTRLSTLEGQKSLEFFEARVKTRARLSRDRESRQPLDPGCKLYPTRVLFIQPVFIASAMHIVYAKLYLYLRIHLYTIYQQWLGRCISDVCNGSLGQVSFPSSFCFTFPSHKGD